jgi:hypothetical protein
VKVRNIGSNMVEAENSKATILISYATPVAACLKDGSGFIRIEHSPSMTTSKHINKWLQGANANAATQAQLDALMDS